MNVPVYQLSQGELREGIWGSSIWNLRNKNWTSLVVQWTSQREGQGFDPWSGKIPHVVEQLKPVCHNYRSPMPGACALQEEKPQQ